MSQLLPYLGVHLAATGLAMLVIWRIRGRMQALVEGVVMLAVPVFGLLIVAGFHLADKFLHLEERKVPEKLKKPEVLNLNNIRYDDDIVPLRDAYLLNNDQKKRKFFTDAIKQNVVANQDILRSALYDEDREMSYYAVSLITTRMETLETEIFRVEQELAELADSADILTKKQEYEGLLAEYLEHESFIDHVTYRRKQESYLELLLELIEGFPAEVRYYQAAERELLSVGDYTRAESVCEKFAAHLPDDERPYLMYIALYQEMHDKSRLLAKVEELKRSPLRLSKQALEIIRYWGEAHA